MDSEFEAFWKAFPRKVGKLDAHKAWMKARQFASSIEEIMQGVARYKLSKPEYADWCHPATWLRQGRWMDEPDEQPVTADVHGHIPPCKNWGECLQRTLKEGRV